MKYWRRYLVLALASYLLFVITQLPASKVYYFTENLLQEQGVTFYGVQGSIWNGSATAVTYQDMHLKQIAWEIHPLALLTANVSATVRFKQKENSVNALVSRSFFGSTKVEGGQLRIDAEDLVKLAKLPAIKLQGQFSLNLTQLKLGEKNVESIQGRAVWSNASSTFPQKMELGDLFADMTTSSDGVIQIKLGDAGGPLEMDANLQLTPDAKYDFKGQFASRQGRNSSLGRSLGFMGRYNNEGKVEFNKAGELSEFGFLF